MIRAFSHMKSQVIIIIIIFSSFFSLLRFKFDSGIMVEFIHSFIHSSCPQPVLTKHIMTLRCCQKPVIEVVAGLTPF